MKNTLGTPWNFDVHTLSSGTPAYGVEVYTDDHPYKNVKYRIALDDPRHPERGWRLDYWDFMWVAVNNVHYASAEEAAQDLVSGRARWKSMRGNPVDHFNLADVYESMGETLPVVPATPAPKPRARRGPEQIRVELVDTSGIRMGGITVEGQNLDQAEKNAREMMKKRGMKLSFKVPAYRDASGVVVMPAVVQPKLLKNPVEFF